MKKYTNKILCIAAIFIAVVLIISITVDFQKEYRQHPDAFKKTTPTETVIISDNDNLLEIADTIYTVK